MSAVIQLAACRPAVPRSKSVGRRPAGSGTVMHPCIPAIGAPPASAVAALMSASRSVSQSGPTSTSSSRKATQVAGALRQPTLRAAAGPRPPDCSTRTGRSGANPPSGGTGARRSSTTITAGQATPARAVVTAMLSSSANSELRPIVGITMAISGTSACCGTVIPACRVGRGGRRTVRVRGGPPAWSRNTPGHPGGNPPSGARLC